MYVVTLSKNNIFPAIYIYIGPHGSTRSPPNRMRFEADDGPLIRERPEWTGDDIDIEAMGEQPGKPCEYQDLPAQQSKL